MHLTYHFHHLVNKKLVQMLKILLNKTHDNKQLLFLKASLQDSKYVYKALELIIQTYIIDFEIKGY